MRIGDTPVQSDLFFSHSSRAGSVVVTIDPLRFLAGCRTKRLNRALSVISLSLVFWVCLLLEKTSQAVREAATICPRPLQQKPAAAALSQAGRARPDEPIRAIPTGRPDVRDRRQTSLHRQTSDAHHRLMPLPRGGA